MIFPPRRPPVPILTLIIILSLPFFPAAAGKNAVGNQIAPRIHPVTGSKLFALNPGLDIAPDVQEIYLQSRVALDTGILEFLLVQGKRKAYESALSTDASPSQLMAAMILLKWKPGDQLAITLLQGKDTLPLAALLRSREAEGARSDLHWRLAGSNHDDVEKGKQGFWADEEGIHVSLVERAESVIQLEGSLKNPYHNASFGYEIRPDRARRAGAAITLIIRKASAKSP